VREGRIGAVGSRFRVSGLDGGLLDAEVEHSLGADRWVQRFRARRLSPEDLDRALAGAGLRRGPLEPDHPGWFAALP